MCSVTIHNLLFIGNSLLILLLQCRAWLKTSLISELDYMPLYDSKLKLNAELKLRITPSGGEKFIHN